MKILKMKSTETPPSPPTVYTWIEVHVMTEKGTENEKFFVGRLPKIGEAVEMVYVGDSNHGAMRLQLRVKE